MEIGMKIINVGLSVLISEENIGEECPSTFLPALTWARTFFMNLVNWVVMMSSKGSSRPMPRLQLHRKSHNLMYCGRI